MIFARGIAAGFFSDWVLMHPGRMEKVTSVRFLHPETKNNAQKKLSPTLLTSRSGCDILSLIPCFC